MKAGSTSGPAQLDLFPAIPPSGQADGEVLQLASRVVPIRFVRNDGARRYILRLAPDGCARVTVPRRGSLQAAREFVRKHLGWLEKQLIKRELAPVLPARWGDGDDILFRGEPASIRSEPERGGVSLADQFIPLTDPSGDLRPAIEQHLQKLAAAELIPLTWRWAGLHGLSISRVTVRNQRTRWGSCSRRRVISLNWRLIQTPAFVRDYIILHELMHLREMNHSGRFWREVQQVCPDFAIAETWLKKNGSLLSRG